MRTPDRLSLPSAWLHSTACDIVEIQPQSGSQILDWALEVDAVVVVVDPIRLLTPMMLQSLRPVIASGRPIVVVVNGRAISTRSTEESIGLISESLRSIDATIPLSNIIVTESSLALRAYEALYTGLQRPDATPSTRSKAFEIFQHAYTSSDIGSLQRLLSGLIADGYQERTAISTVALALESAFISIASDRQQLREAEATVAELDAIGSRATAHARNISAVHRALDGALLEGSIDDELARAQHDVQHLFMTRFAWTALLLRLRIDDVGSELAAYINGTFGVNLEKQVSGPLSRDCNELMSSSYSKPGNWPRSRGSWTIKRTTLCAAWLCRLISPPVIHSLRRFCAITCPLSLSPSQSSPRRHCLTHFIDGVVSWSRFRSAHFSNLLAERLGPLWVWG